MTKVSLEVEAAELKMLREALCFAQYLMNSSGVRSDQHSTPYLQLLIHEIDKHRPLGSDGKHGSRHTATCGCDIRRCGNCMAVLPSSATRKCPDCRTSFDIVPPIQEES